jgi:hypothetical protein
METPYAWKEAKRQKEFLDDKLSVVDVKVKDSGRTALPD